MAKGHKMVMVYPKEISIICKMRYTHTHSHIHHTLTNFSLARNCHVCGGGEGGLKERRGDLKNTAVR